MWLSAYRATLAQPVWSALPTLSFTQGTASAIQLSNFCSEANNLPLTFALFSGTLPSGVTLVGSLLQYNGTGPVATDSGIIFSAGVGNYVVNSPATSVAINPVVQPGALPVFTVTAAVTTASGAWSFGHAFKQGDVPAGDYVTSANVTKMQSDIRNRWPDGSAKYAVLSALGPLSSGANEIQLAVTSTPTSGPNVAEPTVSPGVYQVQLTPGTGSFPLSGNATFDLADVHGASTTWSTTAISTERTILGPVMSEFHYRYPAAALLGATTQLVLLLRVRAYSTGAIEVEAGLHNGYWLQTNGVSAPSEVDYSVAVVINSTTVFSQANVAHLCHTRVFRRDWISGGAEITPSHDVVYLRSTKMVPNMGWTSPAPSSLSKWTQKTTNLAAWFNNIGSAYGDVPFGLDTAGSDAHIGLLTQWEALYCTTSDPQVEKATIGNCYQWGGFSQHFIDETTGLLPDWRTYSSSVSASNYSVYRGPGSKFTAGITGSTVTIGGGIPPPNVTNNKWNSSDAFNPSHMPAIGYLAYLIEGRYSQLEEAQQSAWCVLQDMQPSNTQGTGIIQPGTVGGSRACWWALRSMGYISGITPMYLGGAAPSSADQTIRASFVASLNNTLAFLKKCFIWGTVPTTLGGAHFSANGVGFLGDYSGVDPVGPYTSDAQINSVVLNGTTTITGSIPGSTYPGLQVKNQPLGCLVYNAAGGTGIPANETLVTYTSGGSGNLTVSIATGSATQSISVPFDPNVWWMTSWMYGFGGMTLGQLADISPEGANLGDLFTVRNFAWLHQLARTQGPTTDFNQTWDYRRSATVYSQPILSGGSDPANPTFLGTSKKGLAATYAAYKAAFNLNDANLTSNAKQRESDTDMPNAGGDSSSFGQENYGAINTSPMAMAVEAGIPQASASYTLITGNTFAVDPFSQQNTITPLSNYLPQLQGASDEPQMSLGPRQVLAPPSWY